MDRSSGLLDSILELAQRRQTFQHVLVGGSEVQKAGNFIDADGGKLTDQLGAQLRRAQKGALPEKLGEDQVDRVVELFGGERGELDVEAAVLGQFFQKAQVGFQVIAVGDMSLDQHLVHALGQEGVQRNGDLAGLGIVAILSASLPIQLDFLCQLLDSLIEQVRQ